MFNTSALGWGVALALLDTLVLPLVRAFSLGWLRSPLWLLLAMSAYALQPVLFLNSLSAGGLAVMNLLWDLGSDVLVTLLSVWVFGERLSPTKWAGVALALVGMGLLTWEP